jgi:ABC-type antimicrobial peptide transport system permease subunit
MGIRLGLGADGARVTRMVLSDGVRLTALGLVIGVGGALALSRVMAGFIWGVSATGALTYMLVCLLLGAAALTACWIPARRASRADVVGTLRVV